MTSAWLSRMSRRTGRDDARECSTVHNPPWRVAGVDEAPSHQYRATNRPRQRNTRLMNSASLANESHRRSKHSHSSFSSRMRRLLESGVHVQVVPTRTTHPTHTSVFTRAPLPPPLSQPETQIQPQTIATTVAAGAAHNGTSGRYTPALQNATPKPAEYNTYHAKKALSKSLSTFPC